MISPEGEQRTVLRCYVSTIVALAKCMGEIYPQAGLVYQDRLLRLSRKLGFDATPQALEESHRALEADLAEFAEIASAWVNEEANHAKQVLAQVGVAAGSIGQGSELHTAMLDDLAEHMETSAEVDGESDVRASLIRYAAGLRAYAKRKKQEDRVALEELQLRTKELEAWLSLANRSETVDSGTGLLNRPEALKQFQARLESGNPLRVLRVEWIEASSIPAQFGRSGMEQIIRHLGKRMVTMVRPHDTVYHWGEGQYVVILEDAGNGVQADHIAGWLSGPYTAVVDGISWKANALVTAAIFESVAGESVTGFVQRMDTIEETIGHRR